MSPVEPTQDRAFLTFSLGPVQTFIAAARTIRDLWAGSYLLSWLTAVAMRRVIRDCGRDAILSPALDGNKLVQAVLGELPPGEGQRALTPCSPNRFSALVPAGLASQVVRDCRADCLAEWQQVIGEKVRGAIRAAMSKDTPQWDRDWDPQLASFFDIRTTVVPLAGCDTALLKRLGVRTEALGWAAADVAGGMVDALKSVRHVPPYEPKPESGHFPPKCSLLGSYEQLGPGELSASARFWRELAARWEGYRGTRLASSDRFCAVSLVKRFAWPAYFVDRLGLDDPSYLRFSDSATVAAQVWLRANRAKGTEALNPDEARRKPDNLKHAWNGQWLHWSKPGQGEGEDECPDSVWRAIQTKKARQGKAPTYYAILMMDGDGLGKLFRGEEDSNPSWGRGPERHQNISRALTGFAVNEVERIVETGYYGELIYSGGDDTLALLPTQKALACAGRLRRGYTATMRGKTVSAGIAVVHNKEDLRFALEQAREAEQGAKRAGRDALTVAVCRRSGEHTRVTLGWELVEPLQELVDFFIGPEGQPGVSDRWAYKLRSELPTLLGAELSVGSRLPWTARSGEVRRLLDRVEVASDGRKEAFIAAVERLLRDHRNMLERRAKQRLARPRQPEPMLPAEEVEKVELEAFAGFVTLCQSASFLARGRDE